jgi:hypothetical protein
MKLFNITDVPTDPLRAQGLLNVPIKVVNVVIPPGESREVAETARALSELSSYLRARAVSRDLLPASYAAAKGLNTDGTPLKVEPEAPTEVGAPVEEASGGSVKRRK